MGLEWTVLYETLYGKEPTEMSIHVLSMQMNSMNSYYTKNHAGSLLRDGASCEIPLHR